jgi:hypothetical protein
LYAETISDCLFLNFLQMYGKAKNLEDANTAALVFCKSPVYHQDFNCRNPASCKIYSVLVESNSETPLAMTQET